MEKLQRSSCSIVGLENLPCQPHLPTLRSGNGLNDFVPSFVSTRAQGVADEWRVLAWETVLNLKDDDGADPTSTDFVLPL